MMCRRWCINEQHSLPRQDKFASTMAFMAPVGVAKIMSLGLLFRKEAKSVKANHKQAKVVHPLFNKLWPTRHSIALFTGTMRQRHLCCAYTIIGVCWRACVRLRHAMVGVGGPSCVSVTYLCFFFFGLQMVMKRVDRVLEKVEEMPNADVSTPVSTRSSPWPSLLACFSLKKIFAVSRFCAAARAV